MPTPETRPAATFREQRDAYEAACPDAATHGNPFRYCGTCTWREPAPAFPFPTTRIVIEQPDGVIDVPCEHIAPGIAITPYLDLNPIDSGEPHERLGGGFTITHTPSGRTFNPGQACIECCRATARRLAALPVDWTTVDASNAETLRAALGDHYDPVIAAIRVFANCRQRMCWHDEGAEVERCGHGVTLDEECQPCLIETYGPGAGERTEDVTTRA